MRIDFVTLFPSWVEAALSHSIMNRARESGTVAFGTSNPRDYCYDRHGKVDDVPYGGEPGMLIRVEPVAHSLEALGIDLSALPRSAASRDTLAPSPHSSAVILTAPTGVPFTQSAAKLLAGLDHVVFLCGHYEGFDHRVETQLATHVFSLGDFVLTNGELPALAMADAVVRLLPGVLGSSSSLEADAFVDGLLSAPNYTRPVDWQGEAVPEVLRSGHHEEIKRWRREQAIRLTKDRRPDLLATARLVPGDLNVLLS